MSKCDSLAAQGGKPPYKCTDECIKKFAGIDKQSGVGEIGAPVSSMHTHAPGFFDLPGS